MDPLRVLIVAGDPLVRAGMSALLDGDPGCTVVGQVDGESDIGDLVSVYQPDVILWDLGWEPGSGDLPWEAGELEELPVPVVALLPDEEAPAAEVWAAGARGLLLRQSDAETLVAALQAAVQGLAVLDPSLVAAALPATAGPGERPVEELTPRELEVLQLLAEGLSNKAIGLQLQISEHTVKFHVNAILGKLGAQSRTEAVVRATRLGLILL
jgi:DNA-binding NarL/FixJ family response regulator